jgi:dihydroorotate dehydrogenase electron transfer subunit
LIQTIAKVISNEQILKELERPYAQTSKRPGARNTLGSWLIWLSCPEIAQEAQPGQFVMVHCGEDCVLPRPFSIHQVNDAGIALFFAVWKDGRGTRWLSERKKGDKVSLFGPLGKHFSVEPNAHKLLLVAGGTGIAPLIFLAEESLKKGYSVKLLRGASGEFKPSGKKNPSQHYPERLLPRITEVKTITSSPDGRQGMVVDLLTPEYIGWADQIFACGPTSMYQTIANQSLLKTKPVQVSLEVRMGCGLGVCYGCTIKTKSGLKQVCKDGPVFDLDDILWDEART